MKERELEDEPKPMEARLLAVTGRPWAAMGGVTGPGRPNEPRDPNSEERECSNGLESKSADRSPELRGGRLPKLDAS